MAFIDQRNQPCRVDMSVNLGRRNVGVAQQGLEYPQVRASFEKMGRKGMAQDVRTEFLRIQAASHSKFPQKLEQAYSAEVLAPRREEISSIVRPHFEPFREDKDGPLAYRHHSRLTALPHDSEEWRVTGHCRQRKRNELAGAQARTVKKFEQSQQANCFWPSTFRFLFRLIEKPVDFLM